MALDGPDLPPLSSADLEALFKDTPAGGPYALLDETAAWLLDPCPDATAGVPPVGGDPGPAGALPAPADLGLPGMEPLPGMLGAAGSSQLPLGLPDLYVDPLLGSLPSLLPLPAAGVDSFMPPLHADSSGAGSGADSHSHGSGGMPAVSIPAAAVVASGRAQKAGAGGAGAKKELTEEQQERIRAKNRRAQQRYREKQKAKAAAADKEFQETARELERMRLENTRLQEQQAAMQQVLTVREDFMGALEQGKKAAERDMPRLPCGCASLAECKCLQGASTAAQAAAPLALAHRGLEVSGGPSCPLTGLTLSQIAELKGSPPEALQQDWKRIAQRLSGLLQQLDAAQGSADSTLAVRAEQVQKHIEDVLLEGQSFCFEHAVYQPTNVQRLFAAALDDGRSALSAEDLAHWEAAADALLLSDSQLERLATARAQFVRSIGEVCAERRSIFDRLTAVEVPDPSSGLRAMQHATAAWLRVHEATQDLTANMNQEHCACMTFVRDAFGWVLSPQQKAVAIVKSWPWFPDMASIAAVALQKRRPDLLLAAPDAPKLLTDGTAASPGSPGSGSAGGAEPAAAGPAASS